MSIFGTDEQNLPNIAESWVRYSFPEETQKLILVLVLCGKKITTVVRREEQECHEHEALLEYRRLLFPLHGWSVMLPQEQLINFCDSVTVNEQELHRHKRHLEKGSQEEGVFRACEE